MDTAYFDALTRAVSTLLSRRTLPGVLGLGILALPGLTAARKKRKKRKKVKRNEFGCVNVGKFCKNSGQCCSGICQGKKGKKKCKGHDQSTCLAGQDGCADPEVDCFTETGDPGDCFTTTGKASFCGTEGDCFLCTKDADCIPFCGPQAACIACVTCAEVVGTDTACVSGSAVVCAFPI